MRERKGVVGEAERRLAGTAAAAYVRNGMRLGIGSGRTVAAFLAALAPRVQEGLSIEAACASSESAEIARRIGIRVLPPDEVGPLDLAVDGADLLTADLDCIKGGGGALARERLVALGAARFVLIAEAEKLRASLAGEEVPVEVLCFAHKDTAARLAALGCAVHLRMAGGEPYKTENGSLIYDCRPLPDIAPFALHEALMETPGVVASGYFLGMAQEALLAGPEGLRRISSRAST
jgi:ribose 5-phosphate isomerase A